MKLVLDPTKFYDREVPHYDALRWHSRAGSYTDAVQKAIVLQLLGRRLRGRRLLEIGTGTGRFTSLLTEKFAEVTTVDLSFPMLRYARDVAGIDCTLIQANTISLPFHDQAFDGGLAINVFSHILDYKAALVEISRVLRPAGFLIVNFPNLCSYYLPAGLVVNARLRSLKRNVYSRWYTLRTFRRAAAHAGLRIDLLIGQVHLPSTLQMKTLDVIRRFIDRLSRSTVLRFLSPNLFCKAMKVKQG